MDQISVFDAKNRLSALLDQVERGEEITITRRGRPVARLVPAARVVRDATLVDRLQALRDEIAGQGEGFAVDELLAYRNDGRR